jgi:predicted dehydrogenase
MAALRYGIIGINGFANVHLQAAEQLADEGLVSIEAVAEPFQDRCPEKIEELRERGAGIYEDYRVMLDQEERFDIVSVPTPIPLHVPMMLACIEHGANVMLEKPPAVLVQQMDRMLAAVEEAGLLCQVGFQNISGEAARELKRHLAGGAIGPVKEMTVEGYWRRLDSYYARAKWAGKVRLGEDWVLDGPLNNPLCHYIHEALFLASPEENATVHPTSVRAELYHAHPIEGEDIVSARAELQNGAVLHTYLTLCAPQSDVPRITLIGEDGRAEWTRGRYSLNGKGVDCEEEGEPGSTERLMRNLVRSLTDGDELMSPLEATRNVILHNNGCYLSSGAIRPVPAELINRYTIERNGEEDTATEVRGLMGHLREAAEKRRLLSEMGVEWATPTERVELDFDSFDPALALEGW